MEQQQIQEVIEKAIELLSSVNQNDKSQTCLLPSGLQKEIDEAGVLRSVTTPNLDTIRGAIPLIKIRERSGDFSRIEYYCFVPNRFPLSNKGYRLFGVDGNRKAIVVYEDYPDDISNGAKIDYSFLISAK